MAPAQGNQNPPANLAGETWSRPPSGPPPPHHPNDTPLADYYSTPNDDLYSATPTDERPPQFPTGHAHHGEAAAAAHPAAKRASWTQKLAGWGTRAAGPINALANKLGSESFLPSTLDMESEKAARILKSFCSTPPNISSMVVVSAANQLSCVLSRGWRLRGQVPPAHPAFDIGQHPDHNPRVQPPSGLGDRRRFFTPKKEGQGSP